MGKEHLAHDPTQQGHLSDRRDCHQDTKDDCKGQGTSCVLDLLKEFFLHLGHCHYLSNTLMPGAGGAPC